MRSHVVAVSSDSAHRFSKVPQGQITLVAGLGVAGDAHFGETVKHRSRVRRDPTQPNLRQVHLIHQELFDELQQYGYQVSPGDLGENILTKGIELLDLPTGARLHIGNDAVVEITGLRNPCSQIEDFQSGLLAHMVRKLPDGSLERRAGVMGIVLKGGVIYPGDGIRVENPAGEWEPLRPV